MVGMGHQPGPLIFLFEDIIVHLVEAYTVEYAPHFLQVKVNRGGFEPWHVWESL